VEKPSVSRQSSANTVKRNLTRVRSVGKPFVISVSAELMNEDTLGRSFTHVGTVGKLSRIDTALPSIKESTLERNLTNVRGVEKPFIIVQC
jgi:hypothetical protein